METAKKKKGQGKKSGCPQKAAEKKKKELNQKISIKLGCQGRGLTDPGVVLGFSGGPRKGCKESLGGRGGKKKVSLFGREKQRKEEDWRCLPELKRGGGRVQIILGKKGKVQPENESKRSN